jgi:hypothetical protein
MRLFRVRTVYTYTGALFGNPVSCCFDIAFDARAVRALKPRQDHKQSVLEYQQGTDAASALTLMLRLYIESGFPLNA